MAQYDRKNLAKMQDMLIDAEGDAEIAEIKRAEFSALTRLLAATIKDFDTVAQDVPGDRQKMVVRSHGSACRAGRHASSRQPRCWKHIMLVLHNNI